MLKNKIMPLSFWILLFFIIILVLVESSNSKDYGKGKKHSKNEALTSSGSGPKWKKPKVKAAQMKKVHQNFKKVKVKSLKANGSKLKKTRHRKAELVQKQTLRSSKRNQFSSKQFPYGKLTRSKSKYVRNLQNDKNKVMETKIANETKMKKFQKKKRFRKTSKGFQKKTPRNRKSGKFQNKKKKLKSWNKGMSERTKLDESKLNQNQALENTKVLKPELLPHKFDNASNGSTLKTKVESVKNGSTGVPKLSTINPAEIHKVMQAMTTLAPKYEVVASKRDLKSIKKVPADSPVAVNVATIGIQKIIPSMITLAPKFTYDAKNASKPKVLDKPMKTFKTTYSEDLSIAALTTTTTKRALLMNQFKDMPKFKRRQEFFENFNKFYMHTPSTKSTTPEITTRPSITRLMGCLFCDGCFLIKNNECIRLASEVCYERDWDDNCIKGIYKLYYLNDNLEKVTIQPMEFTKPAKPSDFHEEMAYKIAAFPKCAFAQTRDGFIKGKCVWYNNIVTDHPRLAEKINEIYYGRNSNKNTKDVVLAYTTLQSVQEGFGTCERIIEKFPFLTQYMREYSQSCFAG